MRRLAPLLIIAPMLVAASGPVQSRGEPLDLALDRAQAEVRAAEAEQHKLEAAAERAGTEAERLRAAQVAAAQGIAAAEARISAADVQGRLTAARLTGLRERLRGEQQPLTALLGGLAMMGRRPPLLAVAGGAGTDEMVRVRVLLDSTLPVIRRRTAALSGQVSRLRQLETGLHAARDQLAAARSDLLQRQRAFAALEARLLRSEAAFRGGALTAGDAALSAGEDVERLAQDAQRSGAAQALFGDLAQLGPAPLRPGSARTPPQPLPYRLPAAARIVEGFGAVNASGVRSRGVRLSTARGAPVRVPASGIIRFAGPFRDYDGIVIIDHGGGWMSLIVNVATNLKPADRVDIGQPLGRAIGAVEVELSHKGRRVSPALIAGSSQMLSNRAKSG